MRVNLLRSLAVRLLGKPICMIEFKCRPLDTLSSGGRHFHVSPSSNTCIDPSVPAVAEQ